MLLKDGQLMIHKKDFQHEFKDNYYELSTKTKLNELRYEKKGYL